MSKRLPENIVMKDRCAEKKTLRSRGYRNTACSTHYGRITIHITHVRLGDILAASVFNDKVNFIINLSISNPSDLRTLYPPKPFLFSRTHFGKSSP